jgi:hypothetical protein
LHVTQGKVANKLNQITTVENDLICDLDVETMTDASIIIKAKQGANADHNIVCAKVSLGSAEVSEQSRMNPDMTKGLYVSNSMHPCASKKDRKGQG